MIIMAKTERAWKIVDAKNLILGRFCSQVTKLTLLGEKFVIINAKDAVISGHRNRILELYVHLREIGDNSNPTHGPFHPNRPDTFLRRRIYKMMPKNARGKEAIKRIHVYISSIPKDMEAMYKNAVPFVPVKASVEQITAKYVTIADICDNMGWTRTGRTAARVAKLPAAAAPSKSK